MKRFQYSLLILVVLTSIISGCKKDWLNAKTQQNLAVPATLQDFQALLDNQSVMNQGGNALEEMASDGHTVTDALLKALADAEANAYAWSNFKATPYNQTADWIRPYTRILYCNLILEGLATIKPTNGTDQQTWNNLKGGALFNRAMTFYELAQVWAPAYDAATAQTDLSIPLRLSSDANVSETRSTVQQTYDQIINDLLTAKGLLSVTPAYKTRPSKPAAFALLARVYMAKRDYVSAGLNADSCLQVVNTLLNFNNLTTTATYPFPLFNNEVIFHKTMNNYSSISSPYAMIDSNLYASYSTNDLRKQFFFKLNVNSSTYYNLNTAYFIGSYSNAKLNFTGLTVDEMYLDRAECEARAGNMGPAMIDLNTLLQTRWKTGTFVPYVAVSSGDALNQILIERKKELLFRGLRWTDLRRLNKEPNFAVTLTRTYNGTTYILQPNSYQYTFPIPLDILQLSGISQNPGW